MTMLTSGLFHSRPGRRLPVIGARPAWQRAALALLAVGLDTAAVTMLVSRHLPNALAGLLLAGLGWVIAGHIATRHTAPPPSTLTETNPR
jgi:hypothetical protein